MNSDWVKFILIALVAMAVCLGGIGGWLLPQLASRTRRSPERSAARSAA